mgnify:FL=1
MHIIGASIFTNRQPIISIHTTTHTSTDQLTTTSIWEYNSHILIQILSKILVNMPSRHGVIYKYKLLVVQILMQAPIKYVTDMCVQIPQCVLELGLILQIQLETVWDMDTDTGMGIYIYIYIHR